MDWNCRPNFTRTFKRFIQPAANLRVLITIYSHNPAGLVSLLQLEYNAACKSDAPRHLGATLNREYSWGTLGSAHIWNVCSWF